MEDIRNGVLSSLILIAVALLSARHLGATDAPGKPKRIVSSTCA